MVKSMTGYGRAKYDIEERQYCVEMKAVNHKYCDLSIKMPRNISYLEESIKELISNDSSPIKIKKEALKYRLFVYPSPIWRTEIF